MIAVVLAGGSGTRFWPLSRSARPKQLIRLWGEGPMIAQTVRRLEEAARSTTTLVVCGERLLGETRAALPWLDASHFVPEPCARNTAPAIGLAAVHSLHRFGDEVMGVFPSDHYIRDLPELGACLEAATKAALQGAIVTLGIEPTHPETGYGYIHFDAREAATEGADGVVVHDVKRFVEKPTREVAEQYLSAGGYVWNSGMFVFKPSTLLAEMARQLPDMHVGIQAIGAAIGTPDEARVLDEQFAAMEKVSIDYGIMENAANVKVVPASFRWSDVGHWAAIADVTGADDAGNVVQADAVLHEVRDSVVYSEGTKRVIAVAGVEGLVIVDTPDALLIVPKERAQDVRELVALLEKAGRDDVL